MTNQASCAALPSAFVPEKTPIACAQLDAVAASNTAAFELVAWDQAHQNLPLLLIKAPSQSDLGISPEDHPLSAYVALKDAAEQDTAEQDTAEQDAAKKAAWPLHAAHKNTAQACRVTVVRHAHIAHWFDALDQTEQCEDEKADAVLAHCHARALLVLDAPSQRFGVAHRFFGPNHDMGRCFDVALPDGAASLSDDDVITLAATWLCHWAHFAAPVVSQDQRVLVQQRSLAPCYDALSVSLYHQYGQWLEVSTDEAGNTPFAPIAPLGLYGIVDRLDWLDDLLARGVDTLQWRVKDQPRDAQFEADLAHAIARCRGANVPLYINDDWELAIKHGAYGVHLGQEDVTRANVALIREAGLALGVSTHSPWEVCRAVAFNPSYIAFGPVHTPLSKVLKYAPLGYEVVAHWCDVLGERFALTCIGGIGKDNIEAVKQAGIGSAAIVTALAPENIDAHYPKVRAQFPAPNHGFHSCP